MRKVVLRQISRNAEHVVGYEISSRAYGFLFQGGPEKMDTCPVCGAATLDNARFCNYCGSGLGYPISNGSNKSGKAIASLVFSTISAICALITLLVTLLIAGIAFGKPSSEDRVFSFIIAYICMVPIFPTLFVHLAALILGIQARKEIELSNGLITGKGSALASIVFGTIGLFIYMSFWIITALIRSKYS
jgi:zinc-ribbon domain